MAGTDKGENLAGDGLKRGEQVYVTVTGYMLHTENETLYTVEFVANGQTYDHTTLHVEDLLNDSSPADYVSATVDAAGPRFRQPALRPLLLRQPHSNRPAARIANLFLRLFCICS